MLLSHGFILLFWGCASVISGSDHLAEATWKRTNTPGCVDVGMASVTEVASTSRIDALRRLVHGDFTAWRGLTGFSRATVEAALGPSRGDLVGFPGGVPTPYRIYRPGNALDVYVWYEDDRPVALSLHRVVPRPGLELQIGEPEAREPSRMPGFNTQWIYASRGLTLHLDDATQEIAWLYAYAPMTLDAYRASWLHRVSILREPVR